MGNNLAEAGAKQLAEVISERILQLKELVSYWFYSNYIHFVLDVSPLSCRTQQL